MRRATVLLAVAGLLALPAVALAADQFTATLTPGAEVPPPDLPPEYTGSGSARVTISNDERSLDYEVLWDGLTRPPLDVHIHYGAPGKAGGILLTLPHGDSPEGPVFVGTVRERDFTPVEGGPQTFAEALTAIRDGDTYVNVHTEQNPSGEIRGQLRAMPDTATSASVSASAGGWISLLALTIGAAVFVVGYRRFAARST